jgi:hypothetical protein
MGKYDPLQQRLVSGAGGQITLTFVEIDALVGGLPPSASAYRAFWANQTDTRRRPHANAWTHAGRVVEAVELGQWVRFSSCSHP